MSSGKEPFSLYVHIPYCINKCPYCDFNSHVVPKIPEPEYTGALLKEMESHARTEAWRGRSLKSVFFGGGTPSIFSPASIAKILEKSDSLFPFAKDIEITLEANPGTVDSAHFSGYRSCGVNRISIGAQSFQPHVLECLGRVHSADETRQALRVVQQAGFENFSMDLIYACPNQSLSDLRKDLDEALNFHPPHLSAYNLTIEEGTPFYMQHQAGIIRSLPEEIEISMGELIEETLSQAGLERYEISNYSRAGFHSRHNVNYWQGGDYLGTGAGAHSYKRIQNSGAFGFRWQNEKIPGRYLERIGLEERAVVEEEKIYAGRAAGEFMFLGLRMTRGISPADFFRRFGKKPRDFYPQIGNWIKEGLMEEKAEWLRLTPRGLLVANSIFVDFV